MMPVAILLYLETRPRFLRTISFVIYSLSLVFRADVLRWTFNSHTGGLSCVRVEI